MLSSPLDNIFKLAEAEVEGLRVEPFLLQRLELLELGCAPGSLQLAAGFPAHADEGGLAQVQFGFCGGPLGVGHGAVLRLESVEVEGGRVGGVRSVDGNGTAGAAGRPSTGDSRARCGAVPAAGREDLVEQVASASTGGGVVRCRYPSLLLLLVLLLLLLLLLLMLVLMLLLMMGMRLMLLLVVLLVVLLVLWGQWWERLLSLWLLLLLRVLLRGWLDRRLLRTRDDAVVKRSTC
ncbi:hypothetical protein SODALDRAFT_319867 [Sodiomyces alkalinus F11]|uniref:Uncharacterized protein n=1 Tax=Sodiomyces alkalinus (strain CBS 110278 / VKM F-3762 / F11) TaxID=1314773 RepID=A0A3N2Q9L4_SODAK|nr:hypothetical protein SODALDRAFT_319867 [Sodiomyces alkalinus F11]ROT43397.1 hypothetical protein SODALDRAFT_319867 [Sodiomyces alkalinus F11]